MIGYCFLCGKWNVLEKHHIFGGANRKKSEKYKLTVDLCHNCHNEPPNGVHHNRKAMDDLHRYGQMKAMSEQNWTVKQFYEVFGKNYI